MEAARSEHIADIVVPASKGIGIRGLSIGGFPRHRAGEIVSEVREKDARAMDVVGEVTIETVAFRENIGIRSMILKMIRHEGRREPSIGGMVVAEDGAGIGRGN